MKEQTKKEIQDSAAQKYSGIDINIADDNKNTKKLNDERTKTLNSNPRNNEGPNDASHVK